MESSIYNGAPSFRPHNDIPLSSEMSASLAGETAAGKHFQLENPEKSTERRKRQLETRTLESQKRKRAKLRGERFLLDKKMSSKNNLRFDSFIPLHKLWIGYISELLGVKIIEVETIRNFGKREKDKDKDKTTFKPPLRDVRSMNTNNNELKNFAANSQSKLAKADFHGALIRVSRSRNPSLIGIEGIVIQETAETWRLITQGNALKVIPKAHSFFTFDLLIQDSNKQVSFEIAGASFAIKTENRVGKKWKNSPNMTWNV